MLTVTSLVTGYGKVQALRGVSLHVRQGELVALIGANGAGKSTILRAISGLLPARRGDILLGGQSIARWAPHRIVQAGVVHAPEGRQLFPDMTVYENLVLGAYRWPAAQKRAHLREEFEWVYSIFPILQERWRQEAGTLSGGEQQMLAIGRALMARPKLLLLDEPSMGLAPMVARQIFDTIVALRDAGLTILLVEQNARAALRMCDRGYVLETGQVVLEGTPSQLATNREVQRAYLGKGYKEVWE